MLSRIQTPSHPRDQLLEQDAFAWASPHCLPGSRNSHGDLHQRWGQAMYDGLIQFYKSLGFFA